MDIKASTYPNPSYSEPAVNGRNRLLAALPSDVYAELAPHLVERSLTRGQVLQMPGQPVERVYFPHGGLVSLLAGTRDGAEVETAAIGRDGCVGISSALVGGMSFARALVVVPGAVSEIPAARLRSLAEQDAQLRQEFARWNASLTAQIAQTVVCATLHGLEARLCRWLLQARDSAGNVLPVKQQMLADFLGVRRTSVTLFMRVLSEEKAVRTHRGVVEILDASVLERKACGCRHVLQSAARAQSAPGPRAVIINPANQSLHS